MATAPYSLHTLRGMWSIRCPILQLLCVIAKECMSSDMSEVSKSLSAERADCATYFNIYMYMIYK